jgi:signal transduction histidine kinase/ActR/RegA family two-component response regulator
MTANTELHLLLVDDDEEDFIITKALLSEVFDKRCKLSWVQNIDEAIQQMYDYDFFLVDYKIGPDNGIEFIKILHEKRPETPVILLTGMANREVDYEAMKAGAYDYLVKGKIDAETLERTIRYAREQAINLKQIRLLNEQLQQRVEEQSIQITRTQEILLTIARNYPNGVICTYNTELKCDFIEGKGLMKHNLTPDNFIGKTVFETYPADQAAIHDKYFKQTLSGLNTVYEINFELEPYLVSTTPIYDSTGIIERIMVVVTNITSIKLAEEKMKQALAKANELNELKSRFVSTASHEFRTPLSTILSSTNLLQRYYHLQNENQFIKHTQKIKSAINNLTQILEDFLSVEKLEEGAIKIEASEFNLNEFVQLVIEDLRDTIGEEQSLHYSHNSDEIWVRLDKKFIRAIIQNLISNAIKYSLKKGNINVRLHKEDNHFELSVSDEGIGIPQQEQPHLFERFYRAQNASSIDGTGIGLNIVKKYIDLMNGRITFESEQNKGTTFYIQLPLNLSTP